MLPPTILVIATYNEMGNLPALVADLRTRFPSLDLLVIDDNSPDGTGRWCDQTAAHDSRFSVIHRAGKLGLGSATLEGFAAALERGHDLVATMDADFSHAPASLTHLLQAAIDPAHTYGLVIGSRYVEGGGIEGWPVFRHVSSRLVNLVARRLLRLPVNDSSGAFRVYRSTALQAANVLSVEAKGYAYLQEIVWRLNRADIAMTEVPITFRDRQHGTSKTSMMVGLKVFLHLFRMALGRVK